MHAPRVVCWMPSLTDDGAIMSVCFDVAIGIGFVIVKWIHMVVSYTDV